jgi:hypothetical protein
MAERPASHSIRRLALQVFQSHDLHAREPGTRGARAGSDPPAMPWRHAAPGGNTTPGWTAWIVVNHCPRGVWLSRSCVMMIDCQVPQAVVMMLFTSKVSPLRRVGLKSDLMPIPPGKNDG